MAPRVRLIWMLLQLVLFAAPAPGATTLLVVLLPFAVRARLGRSPAWSACLLNARQRQAIVRHSLHQVR